jgi:hypothetical protein
MKASVVRESLKVAERPDVLSFAGGLPGPCGALRARGLQRPAGLLERLDALVDLLQELGRRLLLKLLQEGLGNG